MAKQTHLNAFRQASGMCSLSNFFKESRKASTLPIMIFAAFQLLSLGILPLGAVRIMTAAVTLTTASGGDPKDFSSVRLFCKRQVGGPERGCSPPGKPPPALPLEWTAPRFPLTQATRRFPYLPYLIQCVQSFLCGQQGRLCLGQVRFTSLLLLSDVLEEARQERSMQVGVWVVRV